MPLLVIVADDLGVDTPRNRGIAEAVRSGIVTAVSVLANGSATTEVPAILADCARVQTGLHLNLSEGPSLTGGPRVLVDGSGRFPGKDRARAALLDDRIDLRGLEEEIEAQFDALHALGIPISFVNAHQHVHVLPRVAPLVARAAARRGVAAIRVPGPGGAPSGLRSLLRFAGAAREVFRQAGLRIPDVFLGHRFLDRPDEATLREEIDAAGSESVAELMVHPGYADADSVPFSSPTREAELRTLLRHAPPLIARCGRTLAGFPSAESRPGA